MAGRNVDFMPISEHSEGQNSHNIAHNLSGAVAKWFYLWNWHALFVLDNAVSEFKGLKRDIKLKKCYFWFCHCHHNTTPCRKANSERSIWGAGDRVFPWWESYRSVIEILVPKYVNPRYYWFNENTFGLKLYLNYLY